MNDPTEHDRIDYALDVIQERTISDYHTRTVADLRQKVYELTGIVHALQKSLINRTKSLEAEYDSRISELEMEIDFLTSSSDDDWEGDYI